jgi:hypothetical protein
VRFSWQPQNRCRPPHWRVYGSPSLCPLGAPVRLHEELFETLLVGLSDDDRQQILRMIRDARDEQLQRKVHPPTRRRRGVDGVLREPEEVR